MTKSDLRDRASEIIALMEQADDIRVEIKDRFDDAKNAGYTVAALRKAIKLHRMEAYKRKKHEAEQLDFESYLAALEGGLNKPKLRAIQERGDKIVAEFSAALDELAGEASA